MIFECRSPETDGRSIHAPMSSWHLGIMFVPLPVGTRVGKQPRPLQRHLNPEMNVSCTFFPPLKTGRTGGFKISSFNNMQFSFWHYLSWNTCANKCSFESDEELLFSLGGVGGWEKLSVEVLSHDPLFSLVAPPFSRLFWQAVKQQKYLGIVPCTGLRCYRAVISQVHIKSADEMPPLLA